MKLVHILNPVKVPESSDLFVAQPITFESIRKAKTMLTGQDQVKVLMCGYEEDRSIVPDWVDDYSLLNRSILDVSDFIQQRKLPLISDILASVDEPYDYLIYSNVDIGLMPWFYSVVCSRIRDGLDGMVINRRTISSEFQSPSELEMIYAQAGSIHPGLDCFVMSKRIVDSLILENVAIGVSFIGKVLETNIQVHADRFTLFEQDHLTFHLGDDRTWKNPDLADYQEFNKQQFKEAMEKLLPIALKKNNPQAIARVKHHLYRHFDWNEDGENPFLKENGQARVPCKTRIKRSIGALLGKT